MPKIYTEDVPVRAVLRDPQLVEQLVEVPTTVSYAALLLWHAIHGSRQRTVEQNGIPVVGGSGTGGGPSGFLPGQNNSLTAEQIVDNPLKLEKILKDCFKILPPPGWSSVVPVLAALLCPFVFTVVSPRW